MNKTFISLILILLLAPACGKRAIKVHHPKPSRTTHVAPEICDVPAAEQPPLLLEEDIEGFDLLDDHEEQESSIPQSQNRALNDDLEEIPSSQDVVLIDEREEESYPFKTILYDYDKSELRPDQQAIADQNFAFAKNAIKDGNILLIEGHACNSAGSKAYNHVLSQQRAQTLAQYYTDKGLSTASIKVIGRGSEMPIVPFGDKIAQAPNRRVELYALKS